MAPRPPSASGGLLQRKCACGGASSAGGECSDCARDKLSRRARGPHAPAVAPAIVHDVLRSRGRELDSETAAVMGRRFGHDFSMVRVHADGRAAESADAVSALAYTVGRHVVFGAGRYAPGTESGRRLLAHELAHVRQQGAGQDDIAAPLVLAPADSAQEREADAAESQSYPAASAGMAQAVQRKTKSESSGSGTCGGPWSCASGRACEMPDEEFIGPRLPSTWWKLTVMVDIDVPTAAEVGEDTVGHTYVKFEESNGTVYSYGFYPSPTDHPHILNTVVRGCMVHPDTKHEPCVDYPETFNLSQAEYANALATAQLFCRAAPSYDLQSYNCTTFAGTVAAEAGKSLPNMRGTVGSGMFSAEADNPNTLYESLKARDEAGKAGATP